MIKLYLFIAGILILCVFAVICDLWRRKENKLHKKNIALAYNTFQKVKALAEQEPALVFGILRRLNPFVFEELLLIAFKQHAFKVRHNLRYTGDNGIDGMVFDSQGRKYLIQAKRYQSSINPSHVEQFSKVVNQTAAHAGFFIHTGRTGAKSHGFKGQHIHIISGSRLLNFLMGRPFCENLMLKGN